MHELPASDPRNWRNQALIHINRCRHGAQDFLHWHRWYLFYFEKSCGQLIGDANFTLAYWNWSASRGIIPGPFYTRNALNVQFWNDPSNAQSSHWGPNPVKTIGIRGLANGQGLQDDPNVGQSFTQAAIDSIKQQSNFTIFTNQLETSPHNNAHVLVGTVRGHMGDGMSPLDPIFWLHHCNVDRIWAEWQAAGHVTPALSSNYGNQFVGKLGQPQQASSGGAINLAAFGYTYDTLAPTRAATTAAFRGFVGASPEPQVVARDGTTKIAVMGSETRYSIVTNDLAGVFSQRAAATSIRILARIRLVPPRYATPLICKVFVNCPNLTPTTPTKDKHFAGSFSLFGPNSTDQEKSYIVDLTLPLRSLSAAEGFAGRTLKLQIMPVYSDHTFAAEPSFEVKGIEILKS